MLAESVSAKKLEEKLKKFSPKNARYQARIPHHKSKKLLIKISLKEKFSLTKNNEIITSKI